MNNLQYYSHSEVAADTVIASGCCNDVTKDFNCGITNPGILYTLNVTLSDLCPNRAVVIGAILTDGEGNRIGIQCLKAMTPMLTYGHIYGYNKLIFQRFQ